MIASQIPAPSKIKYVLHGGVVYSYSFFVGSMISKNCKIKGPVQPQQSNKLLLKIGFAIMRRVKFLATLLAAYVKFYAKFIVYTMEIKRCGKLPNGILPHLFSSHQYSTLIWILLF